MVELEVIREGQESQGPRLVNLEIAIISQGVNNYVFKRIDLAREKTIEIAGFTYNIVLDSFFMLNRGLISRKIHGAKKKLRRSKTYETFHLIYRANEPNPLTFKEETSKISSRLLLIARNTKILKKGLRDLFHQPLQFNRFIFIIIIMFVLFMAVLVATGTIDLRSLGL